MDTGAKPRIKTLTKKNMNTQLETAQKSAIELDGQILFTKGESMFIGRIVEVREKAIKVDYCLESVWSNCAVICYNYSVWIPKSAVIHDEIGCLTLKKWFINNGLQPDKVYRVKRYFIKDGQKQLI